MAAEDARHAHHDVLHVLVLHDDAVAQDAGRRVEDLPAAVADEPRDDKGAERIEDRPSEPGAGERGDDGQRRPDVRARLHRVGGEHLARKFLRFARLVPDHDQVHRHGDDHHDEAGHRDLVGRRSAGEVIERVSQDFQHHQRREADERPRRDRLELPVAVRVVGVGRLARRPDADEADHVGGGVDERMEAVGKDADRAAGVAEADFGQRDAEIQHEHTAQYARNGPVSTLHEIGITGAHAV